MTRAAVIQSNVRLYRKKKQKNIYVSKQNQYNLYIFV